MLKHGKAPVTVIRRSILSGRVVWIYQGPTNDAACSAYRMACKREEIQARQWNAIVEQRAANVRKLLNDCLVTLPINAELSSGQAAAIRLLQEVEKNGMQHDSEFYEHVREERRRRKQGVK